MMLMNINALLRKEVNPFVLIASYRKNYTLFKIAVNHFVTFLLFYFPPLQYVNMYVQ